MVYIFFDKTSSSGGGIKNENTSNQELAEELHKSNIRQFEKQKVHSCFIKNIWGADLNLLDVQLISKFNKEFVFCCVIDIFSKYAWVVPLKDKKSITVIKLFQKLSDESGGKPNKICVDKGSKFYNRLMKSWL